MSSLSFYLGLVAVCLAVLASCSRRTPKPKKAVEKPDSHEQMLTLLRQYRDKAGTSDPFMQTVELQKIREVMGTEQPGQPITAAQQFEMLQRAGQLELEQGNLPSALKSLQQSYALAIRPESAIDKEQLRAGTMRLAVAYLRLAETENCVHCRSGESCILPIREGGVHQQTVGSKKAVEYLKIVLEHDPDDLAARWLLNIAAMTLGTYPDGVPAEYRIDPAKFATEQDFPRFTDIAKPLGLDTVSLLGGAIADDFDGDGLIDVVVSSWSLNDQVRFYRNKGDGTFEDRTKAAGLIGIVGGSNLVHADYDNDGDLDLLVLRGAWQRGAYANSLLRNDGSGGFRDVTFDAGLGTEHIASQTAAWADYDLDGDLDLYVGNENGASQLFDNVGDGKFENETETADVGNRRWTKGVAWGDFNGDRYPDLYVSNYLDDNRLYRNNQDGTFTDVAAELGVTGPSASFPVWFWDFNNDGNLDIYVPSYDFNVRHVAAQYFDQPVDCEMDSLWQGLGDGTFRDVALEMGLDRVTQPMGANFGDLDNDGFLDFYLGTGYPEYEGLMPNIMYRNAGGKRFVDVTNAGGFGHLQKGHGVSFADFDNDGDQDVLIELGGAYLGDAFGNALFENPGFDTHWIRIKLVGEQSNRSGIGVRIQAEIDEGESTRTIYRWVNSGGTFGSNPLTQQIGLGNATTIKRLHVYWPKTDVTQTFENVAADQFVEIQEGSAMLKERKLKAFTLKSSVK